VASSRENFTLHLPYIISFRRRAYFQSCYELQFIRRSFRKFCTLRLRGQWDDAIVLIFATVVSQTSVKNNVCVLAGYVVLVLQNGALKWKKKLTGVRSRAVTSDHTLTRGLMPHTSSAVSEILEKYGWQVLHYPPYVPDMSPPVFDLFPKFKKPLRGKCFRSIEAVSDEVTRVIRHINNEGVLAGIQDLPKRWTAVIKHNWDYIEGL